MAYNLNDPYQTFSGDQSQGYIPFLSDVASIFYNADLDRAKQGYADAQVKLQANLDAFAQNYPSFKSVLASEGMLNPDGSINTKKFIDSGYLDNLKNQAQEGLNLAAGQALKNARINQAVQGGAGSNIQTAGIATNVGNAARQSARDFGQAYKQESENAYQKGTSFASQVQQDALARQNALQNALGNKANQWGEMLGQQQPGLLQDPDTIRKLVGAGIGMAINPIGGASQAAGSLMRSNMQRSPGAIKTPYQSDNTPLVNALPSVGSLTENFVPQNKGMVSQNLVDNELDFTQNPSAGFDVKNYVGHPETTPFANMTPKQKSAYAKAIGKNYFHNMGTGQYSLF